MNRILIAVAAGCGLLSLALQLFMPSPPDPESDSHRTVAPLSTQLEATPMRVYQASKALAAKLTRSGRRLRPPRRSFSAFDGNIKETGPELDILPEVLPPIDFRAIPQSGGIRLTWLADARNPISGLTYQVTRWAGDGSAEQLPTIRGRELFDAIDCEGTLYHYRLRAVLSRKSANSERLLVRESIPVAVSASLPRRATWVCSGFNPKGRALLSLKRQGRPELGPFPAEPGAKVGDTGWFLEGLNVRDTTVSVQTSIPRFDALGRRVIIDGRPAERTRSMDQPSSLVNLRLTDPCGTTLDLELLLPPGHGQSSGS